MSDGPVVVALAADDERELRRRAAETARWMRDLARRATAPWAGAEGARRLVARGQTPGATSLALTAFSIGAPAGGVATGRTETPPRVAFAFSGQADVHAGMGAGLRDVGPFAAAMRRCGAHIEAAHGTSIDDVLYGATGPQALDDARFAQPALFALQCALVDLWSAWGLEPAAVLGHSLGEYTAAVAAGVMTADEGIAVVVERGTLTQERAREGRMAAVFGDADTVREAIREVESAELAAVNAPSVAAISGPRESVDRALRACEARGIPSTTLHTTHAFHSACVDPLLDDLALAARSAGGVPALPFASTLEGRLLDAGEAIDADYWRRHAREPVRFLDAVRALGESGLDHFVEIGPHATLTRLGEQCLPAGAARWLPSLRRGEDAGDVMLGTAIELWLAGAPLDLARVAADLGCRSRGAAPARGRTFLADPAAGH